MSAYIVVDLTSIDANKLQKYSTLAAKTLISFGGEFLVKGPVAILYGPSNFQIKAILTFPDRESVNSWYHSDSYQAIISLRNSGMDNQFHLIG